MYEELHAGRLTNTATTYSRSVMTCTWFELLVRGLDISSSSTTKYTKEIRSVYDQYEVSAL